jgi:hypothetical protein
MCESVPAALPGEELAACNQHRSRQCGKCDVEDQPELTAM